MPIYGTRVIATWLSSEADDPHAPNTRWRYDAKWGLEWKGDGAVDPRPWWTTDLSSFVSTPERVALWYRLMRECYPE